MRLTLVMKGTQANGLFSIGAQILVLRKATKDGGKELREENKDVDSALMSTMIRMLLRSETLMAGPIVKSDYLSRFYVY